MAFIKGQTSWNKGLHNPWAQGSKNPNWKGGRTLDGLYQAWANMKQRCNNSNVPTYKYWGGRGIGYDKRWENYDNFYKDMLGTYEKGLTLDRIDNNKNYSKDNCRWATFKIQSNNRRDNVLIEYKGIADTLLNWANHLKIKRSTLAQRIYVYKWPLEKALTEGTIYAK